MALNFPNSPTLNQVYTDAPYGNPGINNNGTSGGLNTGGGGNGGSGKVVISYPDTYAIATSTTGTSSPGAGVGGNRVYIWNGTGSITF